MDVGQPRVRQDASGEERGTPTTGREHASRPDRQGRASRPDRLDRASRPDRMDRRLLGRALAASLLLHAAAFLALRGVAVPLPFEGLRVIRPPPAAPAPGTLRSLRLAVAREEIPSPPRPRLVVEAPPAAELAPRPASSSALAASAAIRPVASEGGGLPGNVLVGAGEGEGAGGLVPPVPRSVFPEWDPPPAARGMEVTVRVRVDAEGRPTGEAELLPPTPDPGFNRRLLEKVRRMEYRPARKAGVPVPGWAEITFIF